MPRSRAVGRPQPIFPFPAAARRWGQALAGGAQTVKQSVDPVADVLGHELAHDFRDAGAEGDAAPFGIVPRRVDLLFVIRRHVLGPVAGQGVDEFVLTGEVVAAIMQVHAVTVAG